MQFSNTIRGCKAILLSLAMLWATTSLAQTDIPAGSKVTIRATNITIENVLGAIGKQSGFKFYYSNAVVDHYRRVSLDVKNETVDNVLKLIFKGSGLGWKFNEGTISITEGRTGSTDATALPPGRQVLGRITDADGRPISDVTIMIKGTRQGAVSNRDGDFMIGNTTEETTLTFTSIGYESRDIAIGKQLYLNVSLAAAATTINPITVVHTGYQDIPQERATGSFTKVDSKTLNLQVGTNILDRLKGVASGVLFDNSQVNPASKLGIIVRGQSTVNGPGDPLIVVDNFPYEGSFDNINPNDIENITILKDAAASSIWGTKAGNGVIVITTKKSKLNQPIKLDINSNITITEAPDLFSLKNMRTTDLVDVETFLFNNEYRFADTADPFYPPFSELYEVLFKRQAGVISAQEADAMINVLRNRDVRNDYAKYMYRHAVNQQYAFNLRTGSQTTGWYLSGGYDKNIGTLSEAYKRISMRIENYFTPFKGFQIRTSVNYIQSKNQNGRSAYGNLYATNSWSPQYTRFFDDAGAAMPFANTFRLPVIDTIGAGKLLDWKYYPGTDYQHQQTTSKLQDFLGNLALSYKFKDFTADVKYQYQNQQTDGKNIYDERSFEARNLINSFSQIDPSNGSVIYIVPKGGIIDVSNGRIENHAIRGQLGYNAGWGDHNIVALAGTEVRQTVRTSNNFRSYGYNDKILTSSLVDFINPYPTFIGGNSLNIPANQGFTRLTDRFVSYFANAAYTFGQRYTISASGRRDASNLFGVSTNNKWTPLWSTGLAWNVSKESFYNFPAVPYLKLRATYGYQGNVDQSLSAVTTIQYTGANSLITQHPVANVTNFYNPDLRWEKVGMVNLALDFATKNDRLSGSIDFFQKNCIDLYAFEPVDPTLGLSRTSILKNAGTIRTKGFDLTLNSINLNGQFKWTTALWLSYAKDKVIDYNIFSAGTSAMVSGKALAKGNSVYALYGYPWAGLDPATGEPQGYVKGAVSKDYATITGTAYPISEMTYHGARIPTFFGNLSNTFSWKNLTLTASIAYRLGYYYRRQSINYSNLVTFGTGHSDYYDRWTKPGDETHTDVPAFIYPTNSGGDVLYTYADVLVEKADNIRLQFVTLNYTLNRKLIKKLPFETINLYVNGSDLGILWRANHSDVDPDNQGIRTPRRFAFGISVSL